MAAITRLSLAAMSIFVFCAVGEIESTTLLLEATFMKVHVLITNDLNQSVTVEGPGIFGDFDEQGYRLTKIANTEKKDLTFVEPGTVTITEDGQVIAIADIGSINYFNFIRTHSKANWTERLGNVSISQNASNLELEILGDRERTMHSFYLFEGESVSEQMVRVDGNNITVSQASDDQFKQALYIQGVCQPVLLVDQDKSGNRQEIFIGGHGIHSINMKKENGITTVFQQYF